ncbi:MAG: hypothetical protein AAF621_01180 [Pseudomonadota bacterium]
MSSVSSASAGTETTKFNIEINNNWEDGAIEGNNGWRTEPVKNNGDIQLTEDQYDAVVRDLVEKMSIEMVKQQNPTDKSKFSLDDDE